MKKGLIHLFCEDFTALYDTVVNRSQHFDMLDWAIFKTCLVSLGVLIGSWFAKFFKRLAPLMMVVFVASWIYLFWRMFFDYETE